MTFGYLRECGGLILFSLGRLLRSAQFRPEGVRSQVLPAFDRIYPCSTMTVQRVWD